MIQPIVMQSAQRRKYVQQCLFYLVSLSLEAYGGLIYIALMRNIFLTSKIFKRLRLFILLIFFCLCIVVQASAEEPQNARPTQLEKFIVSQFKQFCMDNLSDFSKTQSLVQTLGFAQEKNDLIKSNSKDKRWIIYKDNQSLTRVNLILNDKSCMISAIMGEHSTILQNDEQTPIEYYLINILGTELIKRQLQGEQQTRIYDSNYQGKTATIILKNEILPSKVNKDVHYYQIILTLKPY